VYLHSIEGITVLICWFVVPSFRIYPHFPIEPMQQTAVEYFGIILLTLFPASERYSEAIHTFSPWSKSVGL